MQTFAELLTVYMARTGISDAELARTIGVRRQTIFRWKEGLVARPRSAEDVLHCAARLRLTPEERDGLLVAAGFPPEASPVSVTRIAAIESSAPVPVETSIRVAAPRRRLAWFVHSHRGWSAVVSLVVLAGILAVLTWQWRRGAGYPVAGRGETLILVGQFANYTGWGQGYNVAGRVQAALAREIAAARLDGVRAAIWPQEIHDEAAAQAASRRSGARLLIWGEYDSGRVLTHFTTTGASTSADEHRLEKLIASPADLSTTINGALPEEVRYLALLTLGQLYIDQGAIADARATFTQALSRPPADPDTLATLCFLLGFTNQAAQPPDLDQAISFYSQAIAIRPANIAATINRGSAYMQRRNPGDLELALADLNRVVEALPGDAVTLNNRGSVFLQIGGAENLVQAIADFDQAILLAPQQLDAYYNRGLAYVRLGGPARWQADFEKVLALDPNHAGAHGGLCWAYALERQADAALPHCDRALQLEQSGPNHDSRGIVYAELGRLPDAIAEFQAYLAWLHGQTAQMYERYGPRREAWVNTLRAGQDPFDPVTLAQLRNE